MFAPMSFPPKGAESIVAAKLLTAMAENNWLTDVISWSNSPNFYPESHKDIWYRCNGEVIFVPDENRRRVKDYPKLLAAALKMRHFSSGLVWASRSYRAASQLLLRKKYDVVISRSNPYWGHLPALRLSKSIEIPWIAVWNDPFPLNKAPRPYGEGKTASIPIPFRRFLNDIARSADCHVFCCERLRNYMCSYYPIKGTIKTEIIPHIYLSNSIFSCLKPMAKKFVLTHSGFSDKRRGITVFLEGLAFYLNHNINAKIEIQWIGPLSPEAREAINKYDGILNISRFLGPMDFPSAFRCQCRSSVLVIIEAPCEEGIFLPSKFVDFIQTGKPILAISPRDGTLADIINSHGGGIAADVLSAESVCKAVSMLYSHWERGTLNNKFSSSRLSSLFNENVVLTKYKNLIADLKKDR